MSANEQKRGKGRPKGPDNCVCSVCGRAFHKCPSQLAKVKTHFCGKECIERMHAMNREKVAEENKHRACKMCGKFLAPDARRAQQFCSASCGAKYSRTVNTSARERWADSMRATWETRCAREKARWAALKGNPVPAVKDPGRDGLQVVFSISPEVSVPPTYYAIYD